MGQFDSGLKSTAIAKALSLSRGVVDYTKLQDSQRIEGNSIPKAPRRKSYTEADERLLLRFVRLYPKATYA